uniref:Uncharacterized protein n=1 Tax=Panagrolaimus sp. PS1159 TaxID=55785 RepID=A0AC35GIT7_9BILA
MSLLVTEFNKLKIAAENETISFKDFQSYFDGIFDGHLELLQALHWLEKNIQNLWEKSNFTVIYDCEEAEKLMEKIYAMLPFDDSGTVWFGGIIPSKNKCYNNLSSIKTSFFNTYIIVAASTRNLLFIKKMYERIFYCIPTSVLFCESFMENDTRLISTLLAFLQIEKNHPGLSLNYTFVDLFVALLLQFQGNAASMFVEFLATETVMIPFVLRSLKYLDGKVLLLKESYERLGNADDQKLLQNERILFKRSSQPSSNIVLSINGIDDNHRVMISKRKESKDMILAAKDNNFNIVRFFQEFYQIVLISHRQNSFPFKSDALVKCLYSFYSCISKA